jgi:RNA polymerase sigma factor (sigma-70 family)
VTATTVGCGGADVADLLARAARREADAWSALHDRYHRLLLTVCRAQGLTEADSADIAQETWLVLIEHLSDIRDPEALVGWLATTARRRSIRHRQGIRREAPLEEYLDTRGVSVDVDEHLDAENRRRALHRAVATLGPRERALVTALLDPAEPSYKEIAERLTMPVGSIGPVRQRALRRLRALLETDDAVRTAQPEAA